MKKPGEIIDYEIKKEFTDRNEPRSIFWKWYDKSNTNLDDFFVLSFYGIGGIGKSCLVDQLCRELTEKAGIFVKYDFEYARGIDPYNILLGLKHSIRNKYGDSFHFPLFNAALIVHSKKTDENFVNDETVKSIVVEEPHLQNAVNALSLIPIVGGYLQNAISFTSQFYADLDNFTNDKNLKSKYKKYLQEMATLEADELRAKIPLYFWNDMTENMKKISKPLVIFFDTYEKYIDTFKAASNVVLDSWLRESTRSLIQRVPGILWVISGRDKLTWGDNGEWDDEHLGCYEIQDFLPEDSTGYLQKAGITDEGLIRHICELTKGVPIYLDLCVDTYFLLLDKGITPGIENFEVDQRKIVNRYVKYLDSANRDLVYMLAAMGSWRDEEAEYVGEHISSVAFSTERYFAMVQHSFYTIDEAGRRKMHSIVADALVSEMNDSTSNEVNGHLFHYRVKRISEENHLVIETIDVLTEAAELFCKISKDIYAGQYEDYRKLTEEITNIGERGFIFDSLRISTMLNDHCEKVFGQTKYHGKSLKIYSDSLWSIGKYEHALLSGNLSYSIMKSLFGKDHPETLSSLHGVGVCYSSLGRYEKALEVRQKVYEARKRMLGEEHSVTLLSLHSIGVDYGNLGRYEEALEVDRKVYEARKRVLGEKHLDTLRSLQNIGVDYSDLGRHEEALEVDRKVYEARKRVLGEDHPDTIDSLHNMGAVYSNLGRHEEALKVKQKAYKARERVLGEDHPATLRILHSIGVDYSNLGRHKEALEVNRKVYETRERVLGEDHPDTLRTLNNIGVDYSNLGRHKEALEVNRKVYEARKRVLGEDHPNTIDSLHNIGAVYVNLGCHEEALKVNRKVYEARKRVLGEEHPDTLSSLNSIGEVYSILGRHEEALEVQQKVYEARKLLLGEEHPDTLNSLHNLGEEYWKLNRRNEALTAFNILQKIQSEYYKNTELCKRILDHT